MTTYYVDGTNGSNSNNGTSTGTAFATVAYALNQSTFDDKIYVRTGIYTDTWPYQKVVGRWIEAYQGEDVTIDCQGTRAYVSNDKIDMAAGGNVVSFNLRLIGLKIVNYTDTGIYLNGNNGVFGNLPLDIINCFFKGATTSGTTGLRLQMGNGGEVTRIENCTFANNANGYWSFALSESYFRMNAFKGNTVNRNGNGGGETITSFTCSQEKDYNAYPGNTETHGIDTSSSPFSFNDEPNNDFSLPASSSLRGAGKNGANIGATFNPRVYFDSEFSNLALSSGSNDILYYDPGIPGPGSEGPSDAGPAVFASGIWKIDNITVPGARSARVHFGPFTMPSGSRITVAGWVANEDTSPSAGSKLVVDSDISNSTRTIQISLDSGSKQTVTKTTSISTNATTIDIYVTLTSKGI